MVRTRGFSRCEQYGRGARAHAPVDARAHAPASAPHTLTLALTLNTHSRTHSRSHLQGRFVNEFDKRRARLDLKRQQLVESRLLTTKKDTPAGRRRPVSAQGTDSEWHGATPLEPWVLPAADDEKRGTSSLLPELAPAQFSGKWDS